MSFNFPNSPIEGTTYTPVGGYQYVFTDGKWRVVESPQVRATAETRNRIVNGAMQISQENGNTAQGPVTVTNFYAADQWVLNSSTSTGTLTAQRVQSVTPNGSKDRVRMTVGTAKASLAAGDFAIFFTALEGNKVADFRYGSASARQVVLRFGWKSPAGTYGVSIINGAGNRNYMMTFTIAAGSANTDTTQTLTIPGDVTGTWLTDTGVGMYLTFCFAAGTTYQGATGWSATGVYLTSGGTNGMATAGNVFELYDVGLYLDPDATGLPPKWTMPDEAQELAACQRYWEATGTTDIDSTRFSGNVTSGQTYYFTQRFIATKRANPAMSGINSAAVAFPAGVGGMNGNTQGFYESRVANLTQVGLFYCHWIANARM